MITWHENRAGGKPISDSPSDQGAADAATCYLKARSTKKLHRQRTLEQPRCLIPRLDSAILSLEWKETVWDRFVTEAPRPRTLSEQQYSDRKLRSRR